MKNPRRYLIGNIVAIVRHSNLNEKSPLTLINSKEMIPCLSRKFHKKKERKKKRKKEKRIHVNLTEIAPPEAARKCFIAELDAGRNYFYSETELTSLKISKLNLPDCSTENLFPDICNERRFECRPSNRSSKSLLLL